jgi:hypothetical protein
MWAAGNETQITTVDEESDAAFVQIDGGWRAAERSAAPPDRLWPNSCSGSGGNP